MLTMLYVGVERAVLMVLIQYFLLTPDLAQFIIQMLRMTRFECVVLGLFHGGGEDPPINLIHLIFQSVLLYIHYLLNFLLKFNRIDICVVRGVLAFVG